MFYGSVQTKRERTPKEIHEQTWDKDIQNKLRKRRRME
jgi:hypothetical protein